MPACLPEQFCVTPDVDQFKRYLAASDSLIRIVTLARVFSRKLIRVPRGVRRFFALVLALPFGATRNFAGLTRTIQIRVDLRMYPEYPEGANQDFLLGQLKGINLAYNSYFKWSDNSWTKLNLYEYLIGEGELRDLTLLEGTGLFEGANTAAQLLVKEDGSYTYTQFKPVAHGTASSDGLEEDASFAFGIAVTDGDGDKASTTLTVKINDDVPVADTVTADVVLDDDAQLGGMPVAPAM